MAVNRVMYCLFLVAFIASACAISKKRNEHGREDADGSDEAAVGGADAGDSNTSDGTTGNGECDSAGVICGNGIVEGTEICDDGNFYQRDGCTGRCELSCMSDDDCDDLNSCNGLERCTDEGACDDSDPGLEEGAVCGENSSCWRGVCVQNICGDAKRDPGEQCDDGNLDPDDGCTPDCELSCEDDSDCSRKSECLADSVCRDDGHHGGLRVCVGGSALEDRTECEIKDATTKALCGDPDIAEDGWCISGVCTCSGCGNGEVEGIEECDDGLLNGTAESPNNCSRNCRVVACGNGLLEGDEECDDGNDRRMDGCDPQCRYEFAHLITGVRILKEVDVPKWCKHRGNRFADAFTEEVMMRPIPITFNSMRSFGGTTGLLSRHVLHILDSDDTSMKTADREITIGFYQIDHAPYHDVFEVKPSDMPVTIKANQLDEQTLLPFGYHTVPAIQAGGGRVFSSKPTELKLLSPSGGFGIMHDFMMQLVFDMSALSPPGAEAFLSRDTIKVSDKIRLPEHSGQGSMGLFCGAIGPKFFSQLPAITAITASDTYQYRKKSGDQIGMPYRYCENDVLTDQCDSMADLIQQGCTICVDFKNMDEQEMNSLEQFAKVDINCYLTDETSTLCFDIVRGIEFDVDSDGDGENDSWSVLLRFETERIRIYDVAK